MQVPQSLRVPTKCMENQANVDLMVKEDTEPIKFTKSYIVSAIF